RAQADRPRDPTPGSDDERPALGGRRVDRPAEGVAGRLLAQPGPRHRAGRAAAGTGDEPRGVWGRGMIAIEIREPGGPEVLVPVERPTPVPAAGEVLIKVAAAGVNRPDVFQRLGRYPPPPGVTDIPGLEVSGIITEVASGAGNFRVG